MPITPAPQLVAGPISLSPDLRFWPLTAISVQLAAEVYGPFTPSTSATTKVIIGIVQTSPDATAAFHLTAMVSTDNGLNWTEYAGPSLVNRISSSYPFFGPAWLNCFRMNDDVFTINSSSAATVGLFSFSLTALAWTTRNANIATIPPTFRPSDSTILGINSSGLGVAFLYLDNNVPVILPPHGASQSAPHFMLFNALTGANIDEATVLEPQTPYAPTPAADSDWTQLWLYFQGFGSSGSVFGLDSSGNIWASAIQRSYDDSLQRQRTMKWVAGTVSATPALSVSTTPVPIDPSDPDTINSIESAASNVLRTTDGAVELLQAPALAGNIQGTSAKALIWTPPFTPNLGTIRVAFAIGIDSTVPGVTETFLIADIQNNGLSQRTTSLASLTSPNNDPLLGGTISAEIAGQYIDVVTKGSIPGLPIAGYSFFVSMYYWRIFLPLPAVTTPGPAGRKPSAPMPNQFDFCLHREYRLYCSLDVAMITCGSIPACFSVDERDWAAGE